MTLIVEIFGNPVEHSKSPAMHNAVYKELGLDMEYRKRHVLAENLEQEMDKFRHDPERIGLNITLPHKEQVLKYLDEVQPFALDCGAVNTVVKINNKLKGFNTDGPGYWQSLAIMNSFNPKNKNIAIIGDGGAAKAIIGYILAPENQHQPESVAIGGILPDKTKELADKYEQASAFDANSEAYLDKVANADLVINATPLGMPPHEKETALPDFSTLGPAQICSDVVYVPQETLFLKNAKQQGCDVHYGYGMLLYQGVLGFELFTGIKDKTAQIAEIMQTVLLSG